MTIRGVAGRRGTGVPTDIGDVLSAGSVPEALGGTGKGKKRGGRAAIVACGEAAEELQYFAPRRQALTMPSPCIMVDADRIVSLTYGSCSPVFCAKIVDRIYFYLIIYVRSNLWCQNLRRWSTHGFTEHVYKMTVLVILDALLEP